jgi:hypothetical protein
MLNYNFLYTLGTLGKSETKKWDISGPRQKLNNPTYKIVGMV